MRVNTKIVIDIATNKIVERESYEDPTDRKAKCCGGGGGGGPGGEEGGQSGISGGSGGNVAGSSGASGSGRRPCNQIRYLAHGHAAAHAGREFP